MTLHTVMLDDVARQPWRNGGGHTRELLTWPVGAAVGAASPAVDWRLRVSVADISTDGPFSVFAGVHRAFAVLQGAGVRLGFGERVLRLTPDSAPCHFDGGAPPDCTLIHGPTLDLNLMVAATFGSARLQRADAQARTLPAGPRWRGVFVAEGEAWLQRGAEAAQVLTEGTLAWSDRCPNDWQLDGPLASPRAYWLSVGPRMP